MKHYKNILILAIAILSATVGEAQVKFKLQLLNDGNTYQVSLIPETSYRPPLNLTSTAQVTIKVPTASFEVKNLQNLQPHVEWKANSIASSPEESKEYDYVSFGLVNNNGTAYLRYETGIEIPIFTFENAAICNGEITLMDATDPFMPPNSARKNVGNQITIAGAGGDAYTGNAIKSTIFCGQLSTNTEEINKENIQVTLFPNPTTEEVHLTINVEKQYSETFFVVYDVLGRPVLQEKIAVQAGRNEISLPTSHLVKGHYLLELNGKEGKWIIGQFVKLEK